MMVNPISSPLKKARRYVPHMLQKNSSKVAGDNESPPTHKSNSHTWALLALTYSSLGVVYGDIGTSPLYVFASIFPDANSPPTNQEVMESASLVFWTLTLIPLIKYVGIVMFANDRGEGGTFALYSLLCRRIGIMPHGSMSARDQEKLVAMQMDDESGKDLSRRSSKSNDISSAELYPPQSEKCRLWLHLSKWIGMLPFRLDAEEVNRGIRKRVGLQYLLFLTSILATSLVLGDGVLTPAMSVLSAVSGLKVATDKISNGLVVGLSIVILFILFAVQHKGTSKVGFAFAPIIIIWLYSNLSCGIYNIITRGPTIFKALNPSYCAWFFHHRDTSKWQRLGAVLLCVTGAEAMFADMGHFSHKAIILSFSFVAYPCLAIAYLGQAAHMLDFPEDASNIFWKAMPSGAFFYYMIVISVLASIVASQALITGSYSIMRQTIQLGAFPRLSVVHTNIHHEGQIYVPVVNSVLCVLCVIVVGSFQNTVALGNAYGLSVTGVMVITTILTSVVMITAWRVSLLLVALFLTIFLTLEGSFLIANLFKVPQGGWFTLMVAFGVSYLEIVWWIGTRSIRNSNLKDQAKLAQQLRTTYDRIDEHLEAEANERKSRKSAFFKEGLLKEHGNDGGIKESKSGGDYFGPTSMSSAYKRYSPAPVMESLTTVDHIDERSRNVEHTMMKQSYNDNGALLSNNLPKSPMTNASGSRPISEAKEDISSNSDADSKGNLGSIKRKSKRAEGLIRLSARSFFKVHKLDPNSTKSVATWNSTSNLELWCAISGRALPLRRIPGIGMYYSETPVGIPFVALHMLQRIPVLHEIVIFVSLRFMPVPHVDLLDRLSVRHIQGLPHFYQAVFCYGYHDIVDQGPQAIALIIATLCRSATDSQGTNSERPPRKSVGVNRSGLDNGGDIQDNFNYDGDGGGDATMKTPPYQQTNHDDRLSPTQDSNRKLHPTAPESACLDVLQKEKDLIKRDPSTPSKESVANADNEGPPDIASTSVQSNVAQFAMCPSIAKSSASAIKTMSEISSADNDGDFIIEAGSVFHQKQLSYRESNPRSLQKQSYKGSSGAHHLSPLQQPQQRENDDGNKKPNLYRSESDAPSFQEINTPIPLSPGNQASSLSPKAPQWVSAHPHDLDIIQDVTLQFPWIQNSLMRTSWMVKPGSKSSYVFKSPLGRNNRQMKDDNDDPESQMGDVDPIREKSNVVKITIDRDLNAPSNPSVHAESIFDQKAYLGRKTCPVPSLKDGNITSRRREGSEVPSGSNRRDQIQANVKDSSGIGSESVGPEPSQDSALQALKPVNLTRRGGVVGEPAGTEEASAVHPHSLQTAFPKSPSLPHILENEVYGNQKSSNSGNTPMEGDSLMNKNEALRVRLSPFSTDQTKVADYESLSSAMNNSLSVENKLKGVASNNASDQTNDDGFDTTQVKNKRSAVSELNSPSTHPPLKQSFAPSQSSNMKSPDMGAARVSKRGMSFDRHGVVNVSFEGEGGKDPKLNFTSSEGSDVMAQVPFCIGEGRTVMLTFASSLEMSFKKPPMYLSKPDASSLQNDDLNSVSNGVDEKKKFFDRNVINSPMEFKFTQSPSIAPENADEDLKNVQLLVEDEEGETARFVSHLIESFKAGVVYYMAHNILRQEAPKVGSIPFLDGLHSIAYFAPFRFLSALQPNDPVQLWGVPSDCLIQIGLTRYV